MLQNLLVLNTMFQNQSASVAFTLKRRNWAAVRNRVDFRIGHHVTVRSATDQPTQSCHYADQWVLYIKVHITINSATGGAVTVPLVYTCYQV